MTRATRPAEYTGATTLCLNLASEQLLLASKTASWFTTIRRMCPCRLGVKLVSRLPP